MTAQNNSEVSAAPMLGPRELQNLQQLLSRSATDPDFRQKLITTPRDAIAEYYGRPVSDVPTDLNIVFIENKVDATIVLPDAIDPAGELQESELQGVAGGATPLVASVLGVIASALWASKEVKKLGDDDAWFS